MGSEEASVQRWGWSEDAFDPNGCGHGISENRRRGWKTRPTRHGRAVMDLDDQRETWPANWREMLRPTPRIRFLHDESSVDECLLLSSGVIHEEIQIAAGPKGRGWITSRNLRPFEEHDRAGGRRADTPEQSRHGKLLHRDRPLLGEPDVGNRLPSVPPVPRREKMQFMGA
jgi:hypothetical protein